MKKFLLSILALIYLANVSGASLQLHYCMGKLVRIGVIPESKKQCSHCGMTKSAADAKHCCKDEAKKVSSGKDSKAVIASIQYLKSAAATAIAIETHSAAAPCIITQITSFPVCNAPPATEPLYLLFRVIRI
jgi:hypothetical protein